MKFQIQYVGKDGTFTKNGLRLRIGPGNGKGSLYEEYPLGICTPLDGDRGLKLVLSCIYEEKLRAFIGSLPIARAMPIRESEDA